VSNEDEAIVVPETVFQALAWLRKTGNVNMAGPSGVIRELETTGDEPEAQWLKDNKQHYLVVIGQFAKWLEQHPSEQ
jgi:hypothetical protein